MKDVHNMYCGRAHARSPKCHVSKLGPKIISFIRFAFQPTAVSAIDWSLATCSISLPTSLLLLERREVSGL